MTPRRLICVLMGCLTLGISSGCLPMQRSAAAVGIAAMPGEIRRDREALIWPERAGELPFAGHLHVYDEPMSGWTGFRIPGGMAMDGTEEAIGHVRPLADAVRLSTGVEQIFLRFEAERSYIALPERAPAGRSGDGKRYSVFQSATAAPISWSGAAAQGDTGLPPELGLVLHIRRTWFRLASPGGAPGDDNDDAREPRGLAVLMPGIYGTPEEVVDRVERSLLASDWVVLRMLAPPSRTTEYFDAAFVAGEDPKPILERLVAVLDDRAAECAYAVRAAVADAVSQRPELAGLPRTIIGMSGTGILLPTVVALEPEAYDAAVIVAGGANSLRIARESSYRDWIDSVDVTVAGEPPENFWDEIDAAYLAMSALDAYATAPAIRGIETLMIHGTSDRAVPADTGELLWERLGRPARWTLPVGHELVFGSLLFRSGELVEWLNERAAMEPAP